MLRAAASTCCRSAEPSSSGGVPTAMSCSSPCATLAATSVVNAQPAGLAVAPHDRLQARLEDRDLARVELLDLVLVEVEAEHVVARVGEAGAGDQADVAGADDGDVHGVRSNSSVRRGG